MVELKKRLTFLFLTFLMIIGALTTGTVLAVVTYKQLMGFNTVTLLANFLGADPELRMVATNLTQGCGNDEECYAIKIFSELKNFEYIQDLGGTVQPILVWKTRKGDCAGLSRLYCSLLRQVKIECFVNCTDKHCWNQILNNQIVVDLTTPTYMPTNDYYEEYVQKDG